MSTFYQRHRPIAVGKHTYPWTRYGTCLWRGLCRGWFLARSGCLRNQREDHYCALELSKYYYFGTLHRVSTLESASPSVKNVTCQMTVHRTDVSVICKSSVLCTNTNHTIGLTITKFDLPLSYYVGSPRNIEPLSNIMHTLIAQDEEYEKRLRVMSISCLTPLRSFRPGRPCSTRSLESIGAQSVVVSAKP